MWRKFEDTSRIDVIHFLELTIHILDNLEKSV